MNISYHIEQVLEADEVLIQGLTELIIDTVKRGASIGFMDNLSNEDAVRFWKQVLEGVMKKKSCY